MNLTPAQNQAVNSTAKLILVIAGAGSGKTRVLVERIRRLLSSGVDPKEIVAITFTNAAADEIQKRLNRANAFAGGTDSELGYLGTVHGYLLKLLRQHGRVVGLGDGAAISVIDEQARENMIEMLIDEMNYSGTYEDVHEAIKLGPFKIGAIQVRSKAEDVAKAYFNRMIETCQLDFDMILHYGAQLARVNPTLPDGASFIRPAKWLFVDEFQDSSNEESEFYDLAPFENRFFVGDPDQCQPTGTMVRMSDGSEKPIEQIKRNDLVVTYSRHEKSILRSAPVLSTAHREFAGNLYTVKADGMATRCTANHKWLVKWLSGDERNVKLWCVYLMRKGDFFRIGKTKVFRSGSGKGDVIGLPLRMRQEKADAGWILSIHDTADEATANEQIASANYGLPQTCFSATAMHTSQVVIDKIFASIPAQIAKAVRCLQDHNRLLEFPLFSKSQPRTRRTVQEIQACNLIEGIMRVPVYAKAYDYHSRKAPWREITVEAAPFNGTVYSLDVFKHHKYVADGIVTCNSIYSFRGGNVANIMKIADIGDDRQFTAETIFLEENFRSDMEITKVANALIRHNVFRIEKNLIPMATQRGEVVFQLHADDYAESAWIATDILKSSSAIQAVTAVLCRTNPIANDIAKRLEAQGVKVSKKGFTRRPADWRLTKDAINFLVNPDNDQLAFHVLAAAYGHAQAEAKRAAAHAALITINQAEGFCDYDTPVDAVTTFLARRLNIGVESRQLVSDAVSLLPKGAGVGDLSLAIAREEMRQSESGDGVTVTTIHAAKGREWDHVYLPAWEAGTLPLKKGDLEEERRLAYVAMTRARHRLVISAATNRHFEFGPKLGTPQTISQFVAELRIEGAI
jgi:DNA helicase II / ATP-dependent DNA helicase PcrA